MSQEVTVSCLFGSAWVDNVHVCSSHAPTSHVSISYALATYRRIGGGESVSLLFFFIIVSDK